MSEPLPDAGDPSARLVAAFEAAAVRMRGLPIVNPALAVEAVGFAPWEGHWLGVMVTPWFINLTLLLRAITKVLGWRLRGRAWPHPFFHLKTREPIYPLKVLTAEQREALRPLCGPKPALRAQA